MEYQFPVKPDTTLAIVPDEGTQGFEDHYETFNIHTRLPKITKTDIGTLNPLCSDSMYKSDSTATWFPNGRSGPSIPIAGLPFIVDTDASGESNIRSQQYTVPLPPSTTHTEAQKRLVELWVNSAASRSNAAYQATIKATDAERRRNQEREDDENESGRTSSGLALKPWER
jgi:hypothetical protein